MTGPREPPAGSAVEPRPWRVAAVGVLFLAAALTIYGPALRGGFLWDDDWYVPSPEMQPLGGLRRIWVEPGATLQYYPLIYSAFWLQHRLWGEQTLGYHVVNVVLHALGAVLVWRILARLRAPGALLAAAVFLLHPVHVESVAWITELKNTLSGVFYLAALLVYLPIALRERAAGWAWSRYAAALALFVGAVLSKSVTATLPATILVIVWWKAGRVRWRYDVVPLVPFFVVGVAAGVLTAWMEVHHVGAHGASYDLSLVTRLLLAGRVVWFYLGKLVWPADLIFIYPRWTVSASVWWQYLPPIAAGVLLVVLWAVRAGLGRGPLAAILFFAGTLFPVLGFFNVYPFAYSYVADHFQYLASLGVIALAAAAGATGLDRLGAGGRRAAQAACLGVLLALATLAWRQSHAYGDVETLWRTTLVRNPDCEMARVNLGVLLQSQGRTPEAIEQYHMVLSRKPADADTHYNLANALKSQGDISGALAHYLEAVRINPDHLAYRINLGNALFKQQRWTEAVEQYERVLALRPDHAMAHMNLGLTLAQLGLLDGAIDHLTAVVRLHPESAEARSRLASLVALKGRAGMTTPERSPP